MGVDRGARRLANRLSRHVDLIHHTQALSDSAHEDLLNPEYMKDSVRALLEHYVPSYPTEQLVFRTMAAGRKVVVDSNIDFAKANREYHTKVPASHSSLSIAYLLANLVNVRADLHFAARYASEMAVDEVSALIVRKQLGQLLSRREESAHEIQRFQEFVFGEGRMIAEAIRSKEKSFADLLPILRRSVKFKEWLNGQSVGSDVVKEYFREVTKESWVDSLPAKGLRWFLFTAAGVGLDLAGAGGIGTAAGAGLSAFDAFILDRLVAGWKPNQFVGRDLRSLDTGSGRIDERTS